MLKRYLVVLDTLAGVYELEVPSTQGIEAVGRRAFWTAAANSWGDVDEIYIISTTEMEEADR